MKVLVTGATSGLGRSLAENLSKEDYEVIATGRNKEIGKLLEEGNMTFLPCDLSSEKLNLNQFNNITCIVHCAALSSPWGPYHDFYKANVLATQNIIDMCHQFEIPRLIHISTPSVYFNFQNRLNIKEEDILPTKPVNHYVKTKLLAEDLVKQAYTQGIETICFRPRGIIGPYDKAIIPRLFRLYKNQQLPLIEGGKAMIDCSCVDNVIAAIKLALRTTHSAAIGKTYNISNGAPITIKKLVTLLFNAHQLECHIKSVRFPTAYLFAVFSEWACKILPIPLEPMLTRYSVGVMAKSQSLDISLARSLLNYEPLVSIQEAIEKYTSIWKKYLD